MFFTPFAIRKWSVVIIPWSPSVVTSCCECCDSVTTEQPPSLLWDAMATCWLLVEIAAGGLAGDEQPIPTVAIRIRHTMCLIGNLKWTNLVQCYVLGGQDSNNKLGFNMRFVITWNVHESEMWFGWGGVSLTRGSSSISRHANLTAAAGLTNGETISTHCKWWWTYY